MWAGANAVINSIVSKIGILDSFGKNAKVCPISHPPAWQRNSAA
jgi:hypothetical protein